MSDIEQHYTFILEVYFVGIDDLYSYKVRKPESERLNRNLDDATLDTEYNFFVFETIDGKSVAINLSLIQAIHILWEPSKYPENPTYYDGPIKIGLRNKARSVEANSSDPGELAHLFIILDMLPESQVLYVFFTDENGEEIHINVKELMYIEAPTSVVKEGHDLFRSEEEGSS
jgi:hypothetical protein